MNIENIKQKNFNGLTYEELYYLFCTLNLPKSVIADMFNVDKKDVDKRLKQFNIKACMGVAEKVFKDITSNYTIIPKKNNGITLIVDYSKEKNNVHIGTDGASGAIYDVDSNNIARDIGYAVECYVQDYVEAGEL